MLAHMTSAVHTACSDDGPGGSARGRRAALGGPARADAGRPGGHSFLGACHGHAW